MDRLTTSQRNALEFVREAAVTRDPAVLGRINALLGRAGARQHAYTRALDALQRHARVVVHFHPDRITRDGSVVAEGLRATGMYRSQFETGISTGSVTAFAGGPRDGWEERLFGGAYHRSSVPVAERPKYGALELVRYPDGPIPRFGCCYFVLTRDVALRTSFTFAGSEEPTALDRVGVIGHMHSVLFGLLNEVEYGGMAAPPWPPYEAPTLGLRDLTVPRLLESLAALEREERSLDGGPGRVLDSQIEAQIHGPIDLRQDVELLVCDPSFRDTAVGRLLNALSDSFTIPLRWHGGFTLPVTAVPDDFRGPMMPPLARRIASEQGIVDAAVIGQAARSVVEAPASWSGWETTEAPLEQQLKQLWHVLVHYGRWNANRLM
jgi:hypothetical protein